jgi:hypothetical protein
MGEPCDSDDDEEDASMTDHLNSVKGSGYNESTK